MGLRYDLSIKLQQLPTRSWVPSTSILTRLENDEILKTMSYLLPISLGMCVFFIFSDLVDLWRFGWRSYLSSGWNVVDWLSYGIFVGYYCSMQVGWNVADSFDSRLYQQVGFRYDVDSMEWFRSAKIYLSITLVVQIIKVIKFSDQIMPRTALFSSVLSVALPNLLFFMFSFGLTLVAFAMMLSVQMGNVLGEFDTFVNSLMTLFRALFGDFDVEEILENTESYTSAIFFLAYIFIAVFILLSMFLAILSEAQADVREKQDADELREDEEEKTGRRKKPGFGAFGVFLSAVARKLDAIESRVPGGFHTEKLLSRKNSMLEAFQEASISRASVAPHDIGTTQLTPEAQAAAFESTTRARLEAVDQLMHLFTSEERDLMRSRILLEQEDRIYSGPGEPGANAVTEVEDLAP